MRSERRLLLHAQRGQIGLARARSCARDGHAPRASPPPPRAPGALLHTRLRRRTRRRFEPKPQGTRR
eukprot:4864209-Alexandrium_andersonii.AAC.1